MRPDVGFAPIVGRPPSWTASPQADVGGIHGGLLHTGAPCLCCTPVRLGRCSHNPRAERMKEKSAVTLSAMSVQIKKKAPLDLAIVPPTPAPLMWMTGTTNTRSDARRTRRYPNRLP